MTSTAVPAVSITGDGRAAIEKTLNVLKKEHVDENSWTSVFEIQRCIQWIKQYAFKKVISN
jgi:hypothetical protein